RSVRSNFRTLRRIQKKMVAMMAVGAMVRSAVTQYWSMRSSLRRAGLGRAETRHRPVSGVYACGHPRRRGDQAKDRGMTITLEHASAVRLLAGLPHQLGCSPRGSLVLVPVSGRATLGALRLDLPRDDDTDQIAELAIGYLERVPDAEDLVTTIWTDGPALDGAGVAYEALALAVAERAEAAGLRVAGEYCVGDDGWTSYGRPALRPLAELAEADPDPAAILARHPREGADVP